MFKKTVNNFISFFIIFNFITVQPIMAATGISAEQRTFEIQADMIESGVPSDLPIAGYSDFFDKETISLIKDFDLSEYNNMKILVGYGLPDKSSNNCKRIEKPNPEGGVFEKSDFDNQFIKHITYNDHSYLLSKEDTSYSNCLTVANKFGGYPVVIDSAGENNSMKHSFLDDGESLWIGASWTDSTNPVYYNSYGNKQNFFNWANETEEYSFDVNKKNIYMNDRGKWFKENGSSIKKCIVEVESPIYYKPIRTCAPWWKIIREYKNDRESLYNRKDFNKLLNADIPERLTICTKYEQDAAQTQSDAPRRDVTCTSYQSATAKPECALNIDLPQCFVDECSGYIKNACRHKEEKIVGKGYIKGELYDPIHETTKPDQKIKDKVTTHTYECPPSSISMKHCLEKSKVIIFPKECTMYGSNCFNLKKCVQTARDNDAIDKCYEDNYCNKVYASRDIPPKLDAEGNVELLYGNCINPNNPNDVTQVEFVPNILDKESKHCVEYEKLIIEEEITQKCETERTYTEHTVDTSITDVDAYQDNPDCVRIDKVKDSTTQTNVNLLVDLYNFSKMKITQTFIDDKENLIGNIMGDDTYYTRLAVPKTDLFGGEDPVGDAKDDSQQCDIESIAQCSKFEQTWFDRNYKVLNDGDSKDNLVDRIEDGKIYIKGTSSNLSSNLCNNYPSDHNFASYVNGSPTYTNNDVSNTASCTYNANSYTGDDIVKTIRALTSESSEFIFKNDMTKDDCLARAFCLGGRYDESPYSSGWNSTGPCTVVVDGSGSPTSYYDRIKERAGCPGADGTGGVDAWTEDDCKPPKDADAWNGSATLDGLQSILFFEEFIGGGWGFFSNWNGFPFKSNEVYVTSDDITNKRIFPLLEVSTINDAITYVGDIHHVGWRKGEPDLALAAAGGAGAGFVAYSPALLAMGPAGWIVGAIVFVVILILFSKSEKMDEQGQVWVIYKNVANDRYFPGEYETRKDMSNPYNVSQSMSSDAAATVSINAPSGTANHLYMTVNTHTGINYPSDFLTTLRDFTQAKKNIMICAGLPTSEVAKTIQPIENSIRTGYPKCKWYKPWCEKHDLNAQVPTNITLYKPTNVVYLGAVNTLTILVPYKGDYIVKAYNKYDEVIAEKELSEDSFSNYYDPLALPYAKVELGTVMNTSVNLPNNGVPCESDLMVEWGGGVSGVYKENSTTGYHDGCAKSDDTYVLEQAMVKIEVIPKNMTKGFVHVLEKPMPFPNRVFMASLEKLAKRKYRCYDPFNNCDDTEYVEVEE